MSQSRRAISRPVRLRRALLATTSWAIAGLVSGYGVGLLWPRAGARVQGPTVRAESAARTERLAAKDERSPKAREIDDYPLDRLPALLADLLRDPALGVERRALIERALARWTRHDPPAAFAWAQGAASSERLQWQTAVLRTWGEFAPLAAAQHALDRGYLTERTELFVALFDTWGRRDPEQAFAWLAGSTNGPVQEQLQRFFLGHFIAVDPAKAAELAMGMAKTSARLALVAQSVAAWAERDPLAAVAWAQALPERKMRERAMVELAYQWASFQPVQAAAYASELAEQGARNNFLNIAGRAWAQLDPKAAMQWAQSLPDPHERSLALTGALYQMCETDPRAAAEEARRLADREAFHDALGVVVNRWSDLNPAAAAAWVQQFPEGPLRSSATQSLARNWARGEPESYETWWRALPAGSQREEAIAAGVAELSFKEPQTAARWIEGVKDPALLAHSVTVLLSDWRAVNEADAYEWLKAAPLPAALKAQAIDAW